MRVLHILDHSIPLQSGYAFRTLAILTQQQALGWETCQLTGPKQGTTGATQEVVDGWTFFRTPRVSGVMAGVPGLAEVEFMGDIAHRIEQVVHQVKPHLLHAHSPVLNAIPAIRVGHRLDIPVVYEIRAFWEDAAVDHGTTTEGSLRYRLTRHIETFAARHADALVTICEGLRADLVERGIPDSKITVVPNAVDLSKFATDSQVDRVLQAELGLQDAVVLGFLGSFYAYEGLELLIRALPQILQSEPRARILLVGGGPQEDALKRIATELGLADKVMFAGRVPHAEVRRYYDLVDVLIYPRLPMRLTNTVTPLKPLEAMAQRKLVIASDVGGHRELITDGKTGVLFKAGDIESLAQRTTQLLRERDCWETLRENGRRYVEAERSWNAVAARYVSLYDRLTSPPRQ